MTFENEIQCNIMRTMSQTSCTYITTSLELCDTVLGSCGTTSSVVVTLLFSESNSHSLSEAQVDQVVQ